MPRPRVTGHAQALLPLPRLHHAAGDATARRAGRLGEVIIRFFVDDEGGAVCIQDVGFPAQAQARGMDFLHLSIP